MQLKQGNSSYRQIESDDLVEDLLSRLSMNRTVVVYSD